jgi:hypothetical protein
LKTKQVIDPVRVGYQTVRVERHGPDKLGANSGQYFGDESLVGVQWHLEGHQLAVTVLHEVMHGVWHTQAIRTECAAEEGEGDDNDDLEEIVVNSMANGLSQVIRDNPHLVSFLQDELSR